MQLYLPSLHLGQKRVLKQAKRFNYLAAGRRWRKTTLAMVVAVSTALQQKRVLWTAPTFSQIETAWQEFKKACPEVARFNETKKTITFANGGIITFRSLDDPDNARGQSADLIIIDEAGDVKEIAWTEVLRPMLMDTKGKAWILGTPKRRNWFWREHTNAKYSGDSVAWQIPTLGAEIKEVDGVSTLVRVQHYLENPEIDFSEIETLFRNNSERSFRQEILAEFIEETGGVFRNIRECATLSRLSKRYFSDFVGGIDWADADDYTVVSIFDMHSRKQVDLLRFNQIGYESQKTRVVGIQNKWNCLHFLAESNSMGKPIIESLQAEGIPIISFDTSNKSKAKIVKHHQLQLEKRNIQLINDEFLISEHEAYERIPLKSGFIRYSAPEGMHDDIVMSSMLGDYAMSFSSIEDVEDDVLQMFESFRGK